MSTTLLWDILWRTLVSYFCAQIWIIRNMYDAKRIPKVRGRERVIGYCVQEYCVYSSRKCAKYYRVVCTYSGVFYTAWQSVVHSMTVPGVTSYVAAVYSLAVHSVHSRCSLDIVCWEKEEEP